MWRYLKRNQHLLLKSDIQWTSQCDNSYRTNTVSDCEHTYALIKLVCMYVHSDAANNNKKKAGIRRGDLKRVMVRLFRCHFSWQAINSRWDSYSIAKPSRHLHPNVLQSDAIFAVHVHPCWWTEMSHLLINPLPLPSSHRKKKINE